MNIVTPRLVSWCKVVVTLLALFLIAIPTGDAAAELKCRPPKQACKGKCMYPEQVSRCKRSCSGVKCSSSKRCVRGRCVKRKPKGPKCPVKGMIRNADTENRCCWKGQAWNGRRCIGIPKKCPSGFTRSVEQQDCVHSTCSEPGRTNKKDGVHCCWPEQVWAKGSKRCVGVPRCPVRYRRDGENCVRKGHAQTVTTRNTKAHKLIVGTFRSGSHLKSFNSGGKGSYSCGGRLCYRFRWKVNRKGSNYAMTPDRSQASCNCRSGRVASGRYGLRVDGNGMQQREPGATTFGDVWMREGKDRAAVRRVRKLIVGAFGDSHQKIFAANGKGRYIADGEVCYRFNWYLNGDGTAFYMKADRASTQCKGRKGAVASGWYGLKVTREGLRQSMPKSSSLSGIWRRSSLSGVKQVAGSKGALLGAWRNGSSTRTFYANGRGRYDMNGKLCFYFNWRLNKTATSFHQEPTRDYAACAKNWKIQKGWFPYQVKTGKLRYIWPGSSTYSSWWNRGRAKPVALRSRTAKKAPTATFGRQALLGAWSSGSQRREFRANGTLTYRSGSCRADMTWHVPRGQKDHFIQVPKTSACGFKAGSKGKLRFRVTGNKLEFWYPRDTTPLVYYRR